MAGGILKIQNKVCINVCENFGFTYHPNLALNEVQHKIRVSLEKWPTTDSFVSC